MQNLRVYTRLIIFILKTCRNLDPQDSCEDAGWRTRQRPRRIWDAFQFFNELDILELRLHELNQTVSILFHKHTRHIFSFIRLNSYSPCVQVHKFVLVEATRTHSGAPKPLHYEVPAHLFLQYDVWHFLTVF
jgi:hypothetical protein